MALKIINIVLLMCASAVVSENTSSCCPKGQGFLKRKTAMCVDPNTNRTVDINLICGDKRMVVINERNSNFTVNVAGQLVILLKNREDVLFEPDTFCVGHNFQYGRRVAVLCHEEPSEKIIGGDVYYYFMVVSSIFLVVTAIIYMTRRELRDLHGMSIVNFCVSFAIGFGILAGMNLVPYSDMNLCAVRGFVAYFFLVVSFFWMNALSVQILLNMRHQYTGSAGYGEKGLVWYAIYAWGCPAILTTIVAIVNYMPGDHLKPGIGLDTCWFFDKKQQWIYMYSVMTVLIAMNICIFIYATILLWNQSNTTEVVRSKFLMTIRLFVVMGVPWIFEMVSTLPTRHLIWEVLDLINTLQGVLIFLVLCVPLLPCWTRRINKSSCVQYNMNIKIEQPYKKFVC